MTIASAIPLVSALLLATCLTGGGALAATHRRWGAAFALLVLFAATLALRMRLLTPHHIMYVDEPWYEEAARNLIRRGALELCEQTPGRLECHPYGKAPGWPVLLASVFAFTGSTDRAAFITTGVLGALCAPLAAIATILIGGRWHQAVLAGLLVALHPLQALWSSTSETNAPACAFVLAGLIGAVQLGRAPSWPAALFAAGGLGFAAAMRPELALASGPVVAVAAWTAVQRRAERARALVVLLGCGLGALSVPLTWAMYEGNSGGTFLSVGSVSANLARIASDPAGGAVTVAIFLAAVGGAIVLLRRGDFRDAVLVGGAGALIGLAVLAYDPRIFYTRTLLGATVTLVPLAALIVPRRLRFGAPVAAVVVLALVGMARHTFAEWARVPETQALENELPRKVAEASLPSNALVLAEWPSILRATQDTPVWATGSAVMSGLTALAQRRPVYLLCDMYCESGYGGGSSSACREVLDHFALEPVTTSELHGRRYGLYRISGRDGASKDAVGCPFIQTQ